MKILVCLFFLLSTTSFVYGSDYQIKDRVITDFTEKYHKQIRGNGLHIAYLLELSRGNRRLGLFWPAILNGEVWDNDIIGFLYERRDQKWHYLEELSHLRLDDIEKAMGGKDFTIIRAQRQDKVPSFRKAKKYAYDFHRQLKMKDEEKAIISVEKFSRLFSFRNFLRNGVSSYLLYTKFWQRLDIIKEWYNSEKSRLEVEIKLSPRKKMTLKFPVRESKKDGLLYIEQIF